MDDLELSGREIAVDGLADERVHEAERRLGPQDIGLDERAGGAGGLLDRQVGERPHLGHGRSVPEHGRRAGNRDRLGRQTGEPQRHGAPGRARTERIDQGYVGGLRTHALRTQRAEELVQ
ncbi:MAG TPA: hypothetical protein VGV57_00645 [Thermoleophilaceae bacterium]|nr:hypothetical protein [Thermoleophilaceae bacterium]